METDDLLERLRRQSSLFGKLCSDLRHSDLPAWLVGGCLRDLLLGRPCADIDLVTSADPTSWAQSWARGRGHWFWLDRQRRQSRVLLPGNLSIDFAPLRAATIAADLAARDFTINAIALPLSAASTTGLLDPLEGRRDLAERCLRHCAADSFSADPLRILKGIRHAVTLDFHFAGSTFALMQEAADGLNRVAGERLRDELLQILASGDDCRALELLSDGGFLKPLFGAPGGPWDAQATGAALRPLRARMAAFAQQTTTGEVLLPHYPAELFLFAAVLRSYAPADLAGVLQRLRLSRAWQRLLVALQTPPKHALLQLPAALNDRRRALLVERLHPCGQERLFYWGWCEGLLPAAVVLDLLRAYARLHEMGRIPDLLNGNELRPYLRQGPQEIAELQRRIKAAEIAGQIADPDAARAWLRDKLSIDRS